MRPLIALLFLFIALSLVNYVYYSSQPAQIQDRILNGPKPTHTGFAMQAGHVLPPIKGPELDTLKRDFHVQHERDRGKFVEREIGLVLLAVVAIVLLYRR